MWICSLNWVIHDSSVWDHKNHKPYFLTIHPWLEESTKRVKVQRGAFTDLAVHARIQAARIARVGWNQDNHGEMMKHAENQHLPTFTHLPGRVGKFLLSSIDTTVTHGWFLGHVCRDICSEELQVGTLRVRYRDFHPFFFGVGCSWYWPWNARAFVKPNEMLQLVDCGEQSSSLAGVNGRGADSLKSVYTPKV